MKRKTILLSLLALILIVCVAIPGSLAFFTYNDDANGSVPLTLGSRTEIEENIVGLTKTVSIKNMDGDPVWIRAIVYVGSTYAPYLEVSHDGNWTPAGGTGEAQNGKWFYFSSPVYAEPADPEDIDPDLFYETTSIVASLSDIPDTGEFYVQSFGMSVQYESIPVLFDEDGDPIPWSNAEYYTSQPWAQPLDVATSSPSGSGGSGEGENP